MTESTNVEGRLIALHWPKVAAEVTLSDDTNQLQEVTAEIEDREGVTHKVEVLARRDADFLVGKEVSTSTSDNGATLSLLS